MKEVVEKLIRNAALAKLRTGYLDWEGLGEKIRKAVRKHQEEMEAANDRAYKERLHATSMSMPYTGPEVIPFSELRRLKFKADDQANDTLNGYFAFKDEGGNILGYDWVNGNDKWKAMLEKLKAEKEKRTKK